MLTRSRPREEKLLTSAHVHGEPCDRRRRRTDGPASKASEQPVDAHEELEQLIEPHQQKSEKRSHTDRPNSQVGSFK